jgi:mannosyl-oligosaccharide alpha-1,2-mannosidase
MWSPLYDRSFPFVAADAAKQSAIVSAFLHQWNNYKSHCFGSDNFSPLSLKCLQTSLGGGLTIIDSLSTIIIMNLTDEYEAAKSFVATKFRPEGAWSLFEFVIRYIGGLLSASELTSDPVFTKAAVSLGYAILPIMEQTGGFFKSDFLLASSSKGNFKFRASGSSDRHFSLAEAGSFQVEFFTLAKLTGDDRFVKAALAVYEKLWADRPDDGLVSDGIGGGYDSYYEYILKSYLVTGGFSETLLKKYLMIARDIKGGLLFRTADQNLTGIGVRFNGSVSPVTEHLATFAGGMFALGSVSGNPEADGDLALGDELAKTFWGTYRGFPGKVMPERVVYKDRNRPGEPEFVAANDFYHLRPEAMESVYFMWKFTGLQKYRDYAWDMFQGINASCYSPTGYTSVSKVSEKVPVHLDATESFFLAETLKYLFLIFSDSRMLSPTEWVFNTEAHPVRIWDSDTIVKFKRWFLFSQSGSSF